jgi:hypothetical protein
MQSSATQFRIQSLMFVVAFFAVLFSLREPITQWVIIYMGILSAMALGPAGFAPTGRRVEFVYWSMVLHPLVLLAVLAAVRLPDGCAHLIINDRRPFNVLFIAMPYNLLFLSCFYTPVFALVGSVLAVSRFRGRPLARPLWALPAVMVTTWLVLLLDPFNVRDWIWD